MAETRILPEEQIEAMTPLKVVVTDSNGFIVPSARSTTELDTLTNISSNIQIQINDLEDDAIAFAIALG